jgi:hypothetical protein
MFRKGSAYDPVAASFFIRASITNSTQKAAVNTLATDLRSNSLLSLFYALYPFVGGTAASHAQNLISASYPITWFNTPTQDGNGVTFNGTTQYGSCVGLTGNSVWPHACGIGTYTRTNAGAPAANVRTMGVADSTSTVIYLIDRSVDTNNRAIMGNVAGLMSQTAAVALGHVSAQRTSTTSAKFYDDASEIGSYTTSDSSTPPSVDMYLGALNLEGTGAVSFAGVNLAAAYVSQGLTAGQVSTLTTILQTYQTALSRQV